MGIIARETRAISNRCATCLLGFAMFSTGAAGLVAEYILSTVSSYILGNSIEQFSVTIALMMLAMGVAGIVQKYVDDRHLVEKFLAIEVALALLGGFAPLVIYGAFAFAENHFGLVFYSMAGGIGFLIGLEIPLVMRLNEQFAGKLKSNLAAIFSADYVGGFVGALVWAWFLIKTFPLTEISFIVSGFNFAVAGIVFIFFITMKMVRFRALCTVVLGMVALSLAIGYAYNRDFGTLMEQRLYRDRIVYSETTKYQRIVITHDQSLNDHRLYMNGNLQFSTVDEAIYHEMLVHPAMMAAQRKARVLILGGGDGLALREVLKYREVREVVLVDLDPDMVRIARENPVLHSINKGSFDDARVHAAFVFLERIGVRSVYQETGLLDAKGQPEKVRTAAVEVFTIDADRFIKEESGLWDVIVVDFPDPSSIELVKLYSKEFYLKLRRILEPHGVIAIQATSPYHAKEAYLCIKRTMQAAGFHTIPYHQNVPSFGDWGWLLAWTDERSVYDIRRIISSPESYRVETTYLTAQVMHASLAFGKNWLESKYQTVNTLMHPVLLRYYLDYSWKIE